MPTASATITGTTGAGQSVTSLAIAGVKRVNIDVEEGHVIIESVDAQGVPHRQELEYNSLTTLTWTITSADAVIVMS